MSSRLPTSAFERSASSSIVARNSSPSSLLHVTSGWRRLDAGGLDATAERRPEIVRHRLQERGAQLVGLAERRRGRRLGREAAALAERGELRGERVEHAPVVGASGRARPARARRRRRCLSTASASSARVGTGLPAAASTPQPPPFGAHAARRRRGRMLCAVSPTMRAQRVLASRRRPRARASVSASARARGAPRARGARPRSTRPLTTALTDDEHDEREQVLALGDRPGVDRRREEPVGEQEAGDRGDAGRARSRRSRRRRRRARGTAAAPSRGRCRRATWTSTSVSSGRPIAREHPTGDLAPAGQRRPPRQRGPARGRGRSRCPSVRARSRARRSAPRAGPRG